MTTCKECNEPARFGYAPDKPMRCAKHTHKREYDVIDLQCVQCGVVDNARVRFGTETRRPIRCDECRTARDLEVWPAPRCSFPGCDRHLLYGEVLGQPLLCANTHSRAERRLNADYRNVTRAPCIGRPGCDAQPKYGVDLHDTQAVELVYCRKCAAVERRRRQQAALQTPT